MIVVLGSIFALTTVAVLISRYQREFMQSVGVSMPPMSE